MKLEEGLIIRDYKSKDKHRVVDIWSETFRTVFGSEFEESLKDFQKLLNPRYVTLAELGGGVKGFIKTTPFSANKKLLDYFNSIIDFAINGDRAILEEMQESIVKDIGGESQVILHHNRDVLKGDSLEANDIYISDIAVENNMRGRGIGNQLLQASLEKTIQNNTRYSATMCWGGGYSRQLFSKFEFKPIVTLKPSYLDHESAIFMVRSYK